MKDRHPLAGSHRRQPAGSREVGSVDPDEILKVTAIIRRNPARTSSETISDAPLKRSEFILRHGASESDIEKVVTFAEGSGLKVVSTCAARRAVVLSGAALLISAAFGVDLKQFEAHAPKHARGTPARHRYRGHEGPVHVPKDLHGIVIGIVGLDSRPITKRTPAPAISASMTVPQVAELYGFPGRAAHGQTIGIVSINSPGSKKGAASGGYSPTDIERSFAELGGKAPAITDISLGHDSHGDAATNHPDSPDTETTMDICIAAAAAQGARLTVYFHFGDEAGWLELMHRAVFPGHGDPTISVLSCSDYVSDGDDSSTLANEGITENFVHLLSESFHDAALQHITVCMASGDTGADSKVGKDPAAFGMSFAGDGKPHVQYPGSDPWVLSCGGTRILDPTGKECVWNDTFGNGSIGATGGGVSAFFERPDYQAKSGGSNRGVPDVAANASPNSGFGPIYVGGKPACGCGTSAAAPFYAGLIATINAHLGKPAGFINPLLYRLSESVCRSIHAGYGPKDNSLYGIKGYEAVPGWNPCTGLGCIRGSDLLEALRHRSS